MFLIYEHPLIYTRTYHGPHIVVSEYITVDGTNPRMSFRWGSSHRDHQTSAIHSQSTNRYYRLSQTLHVWYIYLHWGGLGGQCRHLWHTWSAWEFWVLSYGSGHGCFHFLIRRNSSLISQTLHGTGRYAIYPFTPFQPATLYPSWSNPSPFPSCLASGIAPRPDPPI